MIKIAFYLDNRHIEGIDFSQPELGNPGTGACEYLHTAIPYFIHKYCGEKVEPVIIAAHTAKLPPQLKAYEVHSVTEAATKAKELGVDFFVFRPRLNEEDHILDHIDRIGLPSIGRAALTPYPQHVRKMANSKFFKALVCVGREQYDYLVDSPLKPKLAYIDNGIHIESCWKTYNKEPKDERLVTYMGALVPMKGFHQLAAAWPKVLKQFPDAKLSVIGSVKMYGDKLTVGPLGVASDDYERKSIMPHLCDTEGKLHPSVTFHGQMGSEKFSILCKSLIGVANPTGHTETCCVSAVEMSACKNAIVSGAYYALLDTVLHNETGLLGRGVDDLADNICALLSDPARAKQYGEAGYKRTAQQYDFSATSPRWLELFEALKENRMPRPYGKLRNLRYHYKLLRLLNALPQMTIGRLLPWPSVYEAQVWIHNKWIHLKSMKSCK